MKKWENPELMILGVENTKTMDTFGSGSGNGNDDGRPAGCFCEEFQFGTSGDSNNGGNKGHDHGAKGWVGRCPCCGGVPQAS